MGVMGGCRITPLRGVDNTPKGCVRTPLKGVNYHSRRVLHTTLYECYYGSLII